MLIPTPPRWSNPLAVLTLMLASCGGHSSDEPRAAPAAATGQATVDATGGLVIGPDQVTLSIAPDSVASNTTFRIARDSSQAPPLVGMTPLSPIYAITPHGSAFDPHALLNLPYDASKVPAGATAVVLRGEPDGSWHVQPNLGTQAGVAVADVGDLSWYAVGVCTPGDAGMFGFGLGDCPAMHSLKLEYLDGQGTAIPVPRDAQGRALPFLPDITTPTDVKLRLTWSRPIGVDRPDTITLFMTDAKKGPLIPSMGPVISDVANQPVYTGIVTVRVDPAQVPGAGLGKGKVARFGATTSYCAEHVFTHQNICWYFDADLVFRVYDAAPAPDKPIITVKPVNVSVVEGNQASFHVDASGMVKDHSQVRWWRRSDPAKPWALAYDAATPKPGVTLSADGKTLTLTAHQAQDNGTSIMVDVCNLRPSGVESCADRVDDAQLTVTSINGPPTLTSPSDQSVPEHSTVDVLMTATGIPYATVEIWQQKGGMNTLLKTCPPAKVTLKQIGGQLPPNPTVCSLHWPDPTLHPADVLLADSGTEFYGKAISDTQANVTSRHATLTVTPSLVAPGIFSPPGAAMAQQGSTASFTATATGSAPLSYQWWFQAAQVGSQPRPAPVALSDRLAVTTGTQVSGIQGSGSPALNLSNVQTADVGNYHVEVSNGTAPNAISVDAELSFQTHVMSLAAGRDTSCAIKADRTVTCWGGNATGQIGDGTFANRLRPTPVSGLTDVIALAVGQNHVCAAKTDRSVMCWGDDTGGQLGTGAGPSSSHPVAVSGLANVVDVKAGQFHTCALTLDGTVACWGDNSAGQLGDGTTVSRTIPTPVPGLSGVIALGAGWRHTCAVKGDGTVACWGSNAYGQLGDGTLVDKTTPTLAQGLTNAVSIATSGNNAHTCALTTSHTVACWGLNSWGQLGDGTMTNRSSPVIVPGLNTVNAITVGTIHTCALMFDRNVMCWGSANNGQLGDGGNSASSRPTPGPVTGLSTATDIVAGATHTCAIHADESVTCWGNNASGQLGDGTTVDRRVPTPVSF
jgi:alpha-tubulin suppressor-like RCC1 family protein